jgi:uncharacterized protein YcbX
MSSLSSSVSATASTAVPPAVDLEPGGTAGAAGPVTLTAIHRYPVKSCGGEALSSVPVEPWGLSGDRRWMLVDATGQTVTAREVPELLLVTASTTEEGLLVTSSDGDLLPVSRPEGGELADVQVFDDRLQAAVAPTEAAAWFSRVAGRELRLVYLDDPHRRPVSPDHSRPGDVVSFADGFPLLLAAEESLAALNDWIAEGPRADDGPLLMNRFRPNLVVSGAPAWEEDSWRRVRIGDVTFRAVKACDRCVMTMIDPATAKKSKEPLFTLAKHRQWDHKTWFAVNLIPDDAGSEVHVGDALEVLERSPVAEPQR